MSVKKLFLLAVVFLAFSCKQDHEVPDNLLSKSEMVKLLIDIRIAEGKVNNLNLRSDSARSLFRIMEDAIFKAHEIDTATYKSSYQYYMLNPEEALSISDAVLDSLKLRQQRTNSVK